MTSAMVAEAVFDSCAKRGKRVYGELKVLCAGSAPDGCVIALAGVDEIRLVFRCIPGPVAIGEMRAYAADGSVWRIPPELEASGSLESCMSRYMALLAGADL